MKRLTAIEKFGSMDVLCLIRTGTLTEGRVQLDSAVIRTDMPASGC